MQLRFPDVALQTKTGILYAAVDRLRNGAAPTNGVRAYAEHVKLEMDKTIPLARVLDPDLLLERAMQHVDYDIYHGEKWDRHLSDSHGLEDAKALFGVRLQQTIDRVVAGR